MKSENYILLVVNPISGDSEKESIIASVTEAAAKRNQGLKIYKTTGDGDSAAIKSIIKKNRPERVLVAGGDGTISLVSECLLNTEICLGIIPAGSANGIAVNFGIPETMTEQIEVALSNCTIKIDTLFINEKMCLHIADLGINAELVKNYEDSGIRGKLGYFLQSIPTIFNSDSPFHFTIETEKGTVEKTGILLAIANANKFGTGANINPDGKINDGKFEVLVFKNLDFIEIFKTIQEKPELSSDFVEIISTEKVMISTRKKVPFQIDGEYLGETDKVTARIEKENLTMAVPELFCKFHAKENML
ncbi:YegS/Rv2252/BmrU family lipid kinase [Aequorivita sp. SDUM287046]|uniref:YegS/Rv2252/BmrU family lipid kinase n=1 Tax=Aequorivita aurantiaca TaxID=3053356 RepID=A0ABT8DKD9_9FLAO|nr:YegS/Rv2252/BmrU family lipid kinase [Aequorivita aurantiaca]MDN3723713.1 YegS/Rv2252/BmrU family lipid kinase [Aequorivita aurantiaca]